MVTCAIGDLSAVAGVYRKKVSESRCAWRRILAILDRADFCLYSVDSGDDRSFIFGILLFKFSRVLANRRALFRGGLL